MSAYLPMPHCEADGSGAQRYESASTMVMPSGSHVCWWGSHFELGLLMAGDVLAAHERAA